MQNETEASHHKLMEDSTPIQKPSGDPCVSISSWRIFPPPIADRRRTKNKKRHAKKKQNPTAASIEANAPPTLTAAGKAAGENSLQSAPQMEKELWRHKQQQYRYTYPYQVGETIRMLIPSHSNQDQSNKGVESPKSKLRKLSKDQFKSIESESAKSSNTKSNNRLVAGFAKVDKIVPVIDKSEGISIHITRQSDQKSEILSPKDQRRLLSPDLAEKDTCAVVLVEETLPFRHVARLHLDGNGKDRVLEIGCSTGELSKLIWRNYLECPRSKIEKRGASWIGMDHSQEMIARCREQLDEYKATNPESRASFSSKVVQVDALEEPRRAFIEATTPTDIFGPSPTVVLIDIGGNREVGPVVKTLAWVLQAFGKDKDLRMVIVKSRALVRQLCSDIETAQKPMGSKSNKDGIGGIPGLDASTGVIHGGTEWFEATHKRLLLEKRNRFEQRFKHPLKAPKVMSPLDGITPICRYHNYHKDGCKLHNDRGTIGTTCVLDHEYCHSCLQKGHVARNCPNRDTNSCY